MIRAFFKNERGSMVIETAFVVPILAILALGGFEASRIVARNTELQSAAAEASAVVLAAAPETAAERTTVEEVIEASTGMAATPNNVSLAVKYRCGTNVLLVDSDTGCGSLQVAEYIVINITDSYTPIWTSFGIGSTINYSVSRRVQVS